MSIADVLDGRELASALTDRAAAIGHTDTRWWGAWCAVALIVLAAPFETLRPVLRVPGQSLSSVEVAVAAGVLLLVPAAWRGRLRVVRAVATAAPLLVLAVAALVAAIAAPSHVGNGLRMAIRLTVLAVVALGVTTVAADARARRRVMWSIVASGTLVALLVVADFAGGAAVERWFVPFRAAVAVVGAQVRASGPFQYPTIASMYLEIAFAVGCGLLLSVGDVRRRLAVACALAVMFEGIVLTFTRAGLITAVLALAVTGTAHWRRRGPDRALLTLVAVGVVALVQVGSSRSAEMLMLRLTSEGQGRWFSAVFDVPSAVDVDTQRLAQVPISITNTGRATWDSDAAEPILLSYHWVASDSDEVVAWEGERTAFDHRIVPGETVALTAVIGGPGRPGRFRLMWDLEQQKRLWFSTEPDAEPVFSDATVVGPVTSMRAGRGPHRIPGANVRPGRLRLWAAALRMAWAHPLLGVGPDNYRLLYGEFSTIRPADPRVHSNNMYVEVLAGMGVAGLAALSWGLLRFGGIARQAWRESDAGAGVAAACAAIAVHGLVDSFLSFTGTYLLMAVILGLAAAYAADGEAHAHRV